METQTFASTIRCVTVPFSLHTPPQTISLSLFISFYFQFFLGNVSFQSFSDQPGNQQTSVVPSNFAVHLSTFTGQRWWWLGPLRGSFSFADSSESSTRCSCKCSTRSPREGMEFFFKQADCGDCWIGRCVFQPFFFKHFFWKLHNLKLFGKLSFRLTSFIRWVETPLSVTCSVLDLNLPCRISQVSSEVLDTLNVTLCTGASHRGAPAPTVPCAKRQHDCFMLLAGVPSWLTDAELRKHAGQFGQVWETFA